MSFRLPSFGLATPTKLDSLGPKRVGNASGAAGFRFFFEVTLSMASHVSARREIRMEPVQMPGFYSKLIFQVWILGSHGSASIKMSDTIATPMKHLVRHATSGNLLRFLRTNCHKLLLPSRQKRKTK